MHTVGKVWFSFSLSFVASIVIYITESIKTLDFLAQWINKLL